VSYPTVGAKKGWAKSPQGSRPNLTPPHSPPEATVSALKHAYSFLGRGSDLLGAAAPMRRKRFRQSPASGGTTSIRIIARQSRRRNRSRSFPFARVPGL
jgi:hypothetical protein